MILMRNSWRFQSIAVMGCLMGASRVVAADDFASTIQPLIENYCYDCHSDDTIKGNVAFDDVKAHGNRVGDHDIW